MKNGSCAGYKYFDFLGGDYRITVTYRGGGGELSLALDEKSKAAERKAVPEAQSWAALSLTSHIPAGKQALFFRYSGHGSMDLLKFEIKNLEG